MKETSVTVELSSCNPMVSVKCDELPDVLGNALVRVVGGVAQELHAVVIGALHPMIEVARGQPAPPADLQPLIEIELIDREQNEGRRQHAEIAELVDEDVPVSVLQRIVETGIPLVEQHRDGHDRQFDGNHRRQQQAAGPAILRTEIRAGNSPDGGERRENASHGESPVTAGFSRGRIVGRLWCTQSWRCCGVVSHLRDGQGNDSVPN